MKITLPIFIVCSWIPTTAFSAEDCSEAYDGKPAQCEVVTCSEKYEEFIGTWEGPFLSFVEDLSLYDKRPDDGIDVKEIHVFRPYFNSITYARKECLRNIENGETFIIGRRTDIYPEYTNINFNTGKLVTLEGYTKPALLVTGRKSDGTPFLRTLDKEFGFVEYRQILENKTANLSVWESVGLSWGVLTVTDGQDFSSPDVHKRNVVVKLKKGKWEGVTGKGFHSQIKK